MGQRRRQALVWIGSLLLATILLGPPLTAQADEKSERAKITMLLNAVEHSGAVFVRNGSRHTATEARKHMERKLKSATRTFLGFGKPKKVTVEAFISKIASRSSMSGKPYLILFEGKKPYPVERWLRATLAARGRTKR